SCEDIVAAASADRLGDEMRAADRVQRRRPDLIKNRQRALAGALRTQLGETTAECGGNRLRLRLFADQRCQPLQIVGDPFYRLRIARKYRDAACAQSIDLRRCGIGPAYDEIRFETDDAFEVERVNIAD